MKILLRNITIEDQPLIVKWRNNPKTLKHCLHKKPITLKETIAFYRSYVEGGKYKQFIVERIDDEYGVVSFPIATVYLKDFDQENKKCELCIFTSDDEEWNNESQVIAIKTLLKKAFFEYNLHKVYTYILSENEDEVGLFSQAGFKKEALLKDEVCFDNERYGDLIRMTLMKTQFIG